MNTRRRAGQLLVDRGLAESRTRAQALILAGKVFSRERRIDKAGHSWPTGALEVRGQDHPWVSRGGLKLDHGLAISAVAGGRSAWISAPPPADLPTCCWRMARPGCTRWMSGMANWPGAAHRSARRGARKDQCPPSDRRGDRGSDRGAGVRRQLHRPRDVAAGAAGAVRAAGLGDGADQAAVRGRAGRGRQGGVVRDPAVHEAVCARIATWWAACPAGGCSASPKARSPGRKGTRNS